MSLMQKTPLLTPKELFGCVISRAEQKKILKDIRNGKSLEPTGIRDGN